MQISEIHKAVDHRSLYQGEKHEERKSIKCL